MHILQLNYSLVIELEIIFTTKIMKKLYTIIISFTIIVENK